MHHRQCRRGFARVLLAAVLASSACDDGNGSNSQVISVGPSGVTSGFVNFAEGLTFRPAVVTPLAVAGALCPSIPPLLAPFSVVFHGDGRSDLYLSQVRIEFIGPTGASGGTRTLQKLELLDRFGSVALPVFGSREFGFSFPFGCLGAPTGALLVVLVTEDSFGRKGRRSLRIPVG